MRINQLYIAASCLALTIIGYAHGKQAAEVYSKSGSMDHYESVAQSRSLYCRGDVRIFLDGASKEDEVHALSHSVSIDTSNQNGIKSTIIQGGVGGNQESYDVLISGQHLLENFEAIYLEDNCALETAGLHLEGLKLYSNTNGRITLRGTYKASSITQLKDNVIDAYWMDSDFLEIESRAGRMILAGTAKHVRAFARGKAFLSLDSLRAKDVWLAGYDESFIRFHGENIILSSYMDGAAHAESLGFPTKVSDQSNSHGALVYHLPQFEKISTEVGHAGPSRHTVYHK